MYDDQVASDTLYSTTYGTKVQNEIKCLIPGYVQVNYKDSISTNGFIDHLKLSQEVEDEWNLIERRKK